MMHDHEQRARLARALAEVGAAAAGVNSLYEELRDRYAEPHRAYHTMVHVQSCLAWLDWYRGHAEHWAEVELAIWFHDAVYDPMRFDNEARSAELARSQLQALGVAPEVAQRVATLVVSTHSHDGDSGDCALLSSIDLTILGGSAEEYRRFEQAIRTEYRHAPESAYRLGRGRVLRQFLARPTIYANTAIGELLERPARHNLQLALWENSGRTSSKGV